MKIRAAILWERGQPLSVEDAELDPPGSGEVHVEVKAAGVCHSDLHPARDEWPVKTPLVLGHEGAGIVRHVGDGVVNVAPGDHVVLCWAPPCGKCAHCLAGRQVLCDRVERTNFRNRLPSGARRVRARGVEVAPFLGTGCFATDVVVAQEGAVRVPDNVPFEALATVGCAVVTGVGAVMTAAQPAPGSSIAVLGAGGVGLNVIQAAVIAGCSRIIAVDREAAPLNLARAFGATDTLVSDESLVEQVRSMTGGTGVPFVFDTVGSPATVEIALALAAKGGTVIVTGLARIDGTGNIPLFPFVMQEKKLLGSAYGSGRPLEDIPRLVQWHLEGRLKLHELARRTYSLEAINEALAALGAAEGARGIVVPEERV